MADSTQSSYISSSQGFGDSTAGQNSAASGKASKISDTFLSSSPVTLIQSPQGESRAGQDPRTSLRSCAQPGSSPVDQGSLGPLKGGLIEAGDLHLKDGTEGKAEIQSLNSFCGDSSVTLPDFSRVILPSSPSGHDSALTKTSPGTGTIKGLEAHAENQAPTDLQSEDGFLVFKECHYGSPLSDAHNSPRTLHELRSPEADSPESPFEVLGDSTRGRTLGSEIADITDRSQTQTLYPAPDLECDVPDYVVKEKTGPGVPGGLIDSSAKPSEVAEWGDGQAKPFRTESESETLHSASARKELDLPACRVQKGASELQPWASSVPPPHLEPLPVFPSQVEDDPWKNDRDEAEIFDADSSDESDDTVIEDTSDRINLSKNIVGSSAQQPKVEGPTALEMRPVSMTLSYIKEVNEQDIIDEDGEYEIVKEPVREVSSRPVSKAEVVQIPGCDKPVSEKAVEPSEMFITDVTHSQQHSVVPSKDLETSREFGANVIGSVSKNEHSSHDPLSYFSLTEEWKPGEMHGLSEPKYVELVSEESVQSDKRPPTLNDGPLVGKMLTVTKAQPANIAENLTDSPGLDWSLNPGEEFVPEAFPRPVKLESETAEDSPETASDPESIEPECSVSAATDSFVGFMRECLHSRQPKDPDERYRHHAAEEKSPQLAAPFSGSPPAVLMNLEEERLTICALRELGSSQEDTEDLVQTGAPQTAPESPTGPVAPFAPKSPSRPPKKQPSEALPFGDVEGAEANEAAQLAAHALAVFLTHLSVRELVYWRDPKKSGVVFGTSLLVLLSLATFSVISVLSYLLLALLCVTITFRVYKSVIQAVQKSNDGHPFKTLMEKDIAIPPETFRKYADMGLSHANRALKQIRRLFLVEDLVDSLKLAIGMWLLTYVGAIFNGITLLILADILLFSSPLVYEKNKTQIDHYVAMVRTQVDSTLAKLQEKLPGAVKRSKAE